MHVDTQPRIYPQYWGCGATILYEEFRAPRDILWFQPNWGHFDTTFGYLGFPVSAVKRVNRVFIVKKLDELVPASHPLRLIRELVNEALVRMNLVFVKGFDTAALVQELQASGITPHIAQNTSNRKSAVPQEIAATEGYKISQTKHKLIEQGLGWCCKQIGSLARIMMRGLKRVDMQMCMNMMAYNLTRMRTLAKNMAQQVRHEIKQAMQPLTLTGQVRPKTAKSDKKVPK